jgi:hypothetical protein
MTAATFRELVARAGDAAKLGMPIHPRMLHRSTGFKLANDGQDTRAIQLYLENRQPTPQDTSPHLRLSYVRPMMCRSSSAPIRLSRVRFWRY